MEKLYLTPKSEGYGINRSNEDVLSVKLAGGSSRQRLDKIGSASNISVGWKVDENGYQYLVAFFNTIAKNGSLPFLCDLLFDRPYLTEHTCRYVAGSFSLNSTTAYVFECSAKFEVLPQTIDTDFEQSFINFYQVYGPWTSDAINLFAQLVTVTMPGNLV